MSIIPIIFLLIGLFVFFSREPKSEWHKYLEKELERNPDYINWLKKANKIKDYKLGLKILKKIKKEKEVNKK